MESRLEKTRLKWCELQELARTAIKWGIIRKDETLHHPLAGATNGDYELSILGLVIDPVLKNAGQFWRGQNEVRELIKNNGPVPLPVFCLLSQSGQKASPIGVFHVGKPLEKSGSGLCKIPSLNLRRGLIGHRV
jgi:hypothetical protein